MPKTSQRPVNGRPTCLSLPDYAYRILRDRAAGGVYPDTDCFAV